MKVLREIRTKYDLDDLVYSERGNLIFDGNIHRVRLLVQKMNKRRDLINYPELAVKTGKINAVGLIFEINHHILQRYKQDNELSDLNITLLERIRKRFELDSIKSTMELLIKEFPPQKIYNNEISVDEFLEEFEKGNKNYVEYLEEIIVLWLANENLAFKPYLELFNDEILEKKTFYNDLLREIRSSFEELPKYGPKRENFLNMLRKPSKEHPHSLKEQLEYMRENWGPYLDKYLYRILLALDLIKEEELFRGLGPGEAHVYEYDVTEMENYTPDKEWMPKVVMIAKNIYVWLDQLSRKYKRVIRKLNDIPDEELDQLSRWGFNSIWLIGVWERSQASKTIKRWCGNPEAEASAYSLYDYVIAHDLGGHESYENLKERANRRGMRLASDMVPNHTGIVSKWTMEHPDWYIALPYPPFPSYTYSGESLSGDPNVGIYLEDKYFSRTDAAVTFKRVDHTTGDTRYIYHGNDGTSFPWNDTAQLNFLNPEVREAVIQTILHVSRLFPIIRFDAAMTLTRKHFQRLWFPEPGTGGAIPSRAEHGITKEAFYKAMPEEFWREVVDRINKENPDTLLLAEAFWLLEGFFVRTLGMHRVYNSAFMNMLRDEDNAKYRAVMKNTLEFDPKILKRFVNFMSNPDEETAINQFGDGDKYFGICVLMVTMPGLPMFAHGQIQGYKEKYGMEYRKAYWDEQINWGLLNHHERIIFPLMKKRYLYADVQHFLLYDFWTGGVVNEDVFAYSNYLKGERALVVYHNKFAETKGFIKNSVGFAVKIGEEKEIIQKSLSEGIFLPGEDYCVFKDYITGLEYIRRNNELTEKGLYVELHAYQAAVYMDFRIVKDDEYFHYAQLYDLLAGRGVPSIHETLQDVIYRPLHDPFERIIEIEQVKKLIEAEEPEPILEEIKLKLRELLLKVKEYSSGKNEIQTLAEEITNRLKILLNFENRLKDLFDSSDYEAMCNNLMPQSEFEWSILFSWIIMNQLGKIISHKDFALVSRSWIDEWQLSKLIQQVLEKASDGKRINPNEGVQLVKLLITVQEIVYEAIRKDNDANKIIQLLLSESEVQDFLNFNRYQGVLWFSAERFDQFVKWVSIITLIIIIDEEPLELAKTRGESLLEILQKWLEAVKKSGYKVEGLLENI